MEQQFKVYKSSAGSGKTFTLVKEFLKICLGTTNPYSFASILAITFTNKATYEMKERIISALQELSEDKEDSILGNILTEELSIDQTTIAGRSRKLLTSVLHNYADLSFSTIDRFSHKILRTFAKDLALPMNFQVELNEEELLQEVIRKMIDQIGKDEVLTALLFRFVEYKMEEEKSWKLESELLTFAKDLLKEQSANYLQELRKNDPGDFNELISTYTSENKKIEQKIKKAAKAANQLIANSAIEDVSFAGTSKISKFFLKCISDGVSEPSGQLKNNVANDKWYSAKCSAEQKQSIDAISTQLKSYFNEIIELVEQEAQAYYARAEILKNSYSLSLINQIEKRFSSLKAEEQLLNISDFNKLIAEVVLTEPMPFIYERLGERYNHLMIDEFQDTSVLQFLNLLPLIDESLAKGKKNLLVGDAKQAIYRFRGGEVEQFAEMPNYIPKGKDDYGLTAIRMQSLKANYSEERLMRNFRSSPAVVHFNNLFFDFVKQHASNPKIELIYQDHQQEVVKTKVEGYVEVSFFEGSTEEVEEIYALESYQRVLKAREEGYRWSEMAILCKKKKHAALIADYLKEHELNVVSSEALLLKNNDSVVFVINLLRWICQRLNDSYKKEILHFIYQQEWTTYSTLNAFFMDVFRGGKELDSVLVEMGVKLNQREMQQSTVYEMAEHLIRSFSFDQSYNLYLQFLLDTIFEFSQSNSSDAVAFLEWWDENVDRISLDIPEEINAVTVMTIHKSKGLEFPVVIYPFADEKVESSSTYKRDFLWVETPQKPEVPISYALVEFNNALQGSSLRAYYEEEKTKKEIDLVNQTYVAFTRAADRLYILTKTAKSSNSLSLPILLKSFVEQEKMKQLEEHRFSLGSEGIVEKEKERIPATAEIQQLKFISSSWRTQLSISQEHSFQDYEEQDAQEYGNVLHDILSRIRSIDDLENTLSDFELKGIISREEKIQIQERMQKLFGTPEIARFFQKEYVSIREGFLVNDRGELIRPDRVVYFEDKLAVIDFKTGEELPKHEEQINKYVEALALTTDLNVEGYLLYTKSNLLRKVN